MKQILGVRFSEHGQVIACVYNIPEAEEGLVRGSDVMASLDYGQSFGTVLWQRTVEDSIDLSSLNFDTVGPNGPDDEEMKPRKGKEKGQEEAPRTLPPVRVATSEEATQAENNRQMCREAHTFCRRCINERQLDMKLVDVETLFDRSKMLFYFTAPTRIDFRELVKDLVRQYRTRIELRQIGVRHETQMLGALGNCGMVCCCRRYLRKFAPVTIKMAKEQNLFLNPAKISGICGRLLCCLSFEQENYDVFHRSCPKLGKRYQTDRGTMRVLRGNMFRNSIVVLPDGGQEIEMTLDEWKAIQPHRPESQPAPPKEPRPAPNLMVVSAAPDTLDKDLAALEAEVRRQEEEAAQNGSEQPEQHEQQSHVPGQASGGKKKKKNRPRQPQDNKPGE